ncbi:MAG: hypothetical protein ACI3X3_05610 [Acidaminococcus sp.]|uniref:hypothetical protein n=1 Tax=Acidaminococcus sp. TaxID=1872103 RepID=UPI003F17CE14
MKKAIIMKLTEPMEQGLLHWKPRLVFPPLASQTSVQGVPGPETLAQLDDVLDKFDEKTENALRRWRHSQRAV